MRLFKRCVSLAMVLVMLVTIFLPVVPAAWAYVDDDKSDIPINKDTRVYITKGDNVKYVQSGNYKYVKLADIYSRSGTALGRGMYFEKAGSPLAEGYVMLKWSLISDWARELNGSPDFVSSHLWGLGNIITAEGYTAKRIHIRDLADLCGTSDVSWDKSQYKVTIGITQNPTAFIGGPTQARQGDTVSIPIRGTSYVTSSDWRNKVSYEFYADSQQLKSNSLNSSSFSDSVSYQVTKSPGSTVTLRLKVTDGVGRSTEIT
ncbi:hypothetical protein, partial [Desulfofundulus sp.]|uniref:hypothetical protein n=1 Tax=Desulfofundulus sp. TaxID=2282750 RepID=UPI003C751DCA